MTKKPTKKAGKGKRESKHMVRLSAEDHEKLTRLAEQTARTLAAENHLALAEHFRKQVTT